MKSLGDHIKLSDYDQLKKELENEKIGHSVTKNNLKYVENENKMLLQTIKELKEKNKKYEDYFNENSIENIEKKLEPYYEEMAKLWAK